MRVRRGVRGCARRSDWRRAVVLSQDEAALMAVGPQVFSERCARTERRPRVFVILSAGEVARRRFDGVIAPAVAALADEGVSIVARRAEIAKTFESFEEVMAGIAEARIVVADVSPAGQDSKTGAAYRDGELMCAVGVAVACRHPRDVLLLRQDDGRVELDGSALPLTVIDFNDIPVARQVLAEEIRARLGGAGGESGGAGAS